MEEFSLKNLATQTSNDLKYSSQVTEHFESVPGTVLDKLNNFPRFVSRQTMSLFLARSEIFKQIIDVHGVIVECGVFMGGGLFTWAQLSSIFEPVNHNRKVVGFDTFEGFPSLGNEDKSDNTDEHKSVGSYAYEDYDGLMNSAELYDLNRSIGHINKIELVKGDALETIPNYIDNNKHLVVSLLYLDFDLYEPTKVALEHFLPRMPKGAVIVFDELNQKQWPGETMAVLDMIGLNSLEIKRFPYHPSLSYAVIR